MEKKREKEEELERRGKNKKDKERKEQTKKKRKKCDKRELKIINFRLNLVAHFGNKEKGGGRLNHLISKNSKDKNRSSKPGTLQST